MAKSWFDRRNILTGLFAATTGMIVRGTGVSAQSQAPATPFQPARHEADAWFDTLPGVHRVILDSTSFNGAAEGVQYATNVYLANRSGYQIENVNLAVVLTLRHYATVYAFNNAMWAKYGTTFAGLPGFTPLNKGETPTVNPLSTGDRPPLDGLARRGAHFAVCGMATRRFSSMIAGSDGDADAVYQELAANTIPNAHIMAAGVVAITRAQEYGYSVIHVG
jgi:hypothetical protein